MRIILGGLLWAVVFAALGAGVMLGLSHAVFHAGGHGWQPIAKFGVEIGVNLFAFGFCFAALPGARRRAGEAPRLGLVQGLWGIAGAAVMLLSGGMLMANILTLEDFVCVARHVPERVDFTGGGFMRAAECAAELSAGWWVVWYFRRLGPVLAADGSAAGLAWRRASPAAYGVALGCAAVIIGLVMVMYHVLPPDMAKLQNLPMEKLFEGPKLAILPMALIAVFLGPVLEEMVFRGIAFGGIAARLGPVWAGVITTLIFTAAHAPEKMYYPPGFIAVAVMAGTAVVLRLRFGSIKPGILLHVAYNGGAMLAAGFIQ